MLSRIHQRQVLLSAHILPMAQTFEGDLMILERAMTEAQIHRRSRRAIVQFGMLSRAFHAVFHAIVDVVCQSIPAVDRTIFPSNGLAAQFDALVQNDFNVTSLVFEYGRRGTRRNRFHFVCVAL